MKFHCPECNAKYRISQDKVASRPNAKLRCKQCSHLFVVREAVEREARNPTVSIAPGADPEAAMTPAGPPPRRPPQSSAQAPRLQPQRAPRPPGAGSRPGVSSRTAPGAGGVGLTAKAPASVGRMRPGEFPVPSMPPPSALAEELAALEPEERSSSVNDSPARDRFSDMTPEGSESPPTSDVRGSRAPQQSVWAEQELEGWFVEADGQPQGPLTEKALRQRVTDGLVDGQTLVWREGSGDWKAAELVGEFEAVLSLAPAASTVENAEDPEREAAEPAAGVADSVARHESPDLRAAAVRIAPPPPVAWQSKARAGIAGPLASISGQFSAYVLPKPGKTVPALLAWWATGVGVLFGLGVGFLIWGHSDAGNLNAAAAAKETERSTLVGEHGAPPPPNEALAQAAPAAPESPPPKSEAQSAKAELTTVADSPASPESAQDELPRKTAEAKGGSLLAGLGPSGAAGPSVGSDSRAGSGPSLTADQIQQAVQRYQPSVKRSCWQRALDGRAAGAPTSARVTVTIQITATGSVTSASTSGDPSGYPGLARCIQSRVAGWKFPSAGGSTTTKVPFVFAAQ